MRIAVTGYASLDHVMRLDSAAAPDRTATILSRSSEWPRLGGSPAYVCAALRAGGVNEAAPVTWVGEDAEGARYRDALAAQGLPIVGVVARAGRSPVCILAHQPDGGCLCFYDPGAPGPFALSDAQRALVEDADALVLTVGPEEATRQALALARASALVVWVVKADPRATPPDLAAALAARAGLVVHARGEAEFVAAAFARAPSATPLRIETRGAEGAVLHAGGEQTLVPADPMEAEETTGAGDTWVGGFLAAHLKHGAAPLEAARAAHRAVRAMLDGRAQHKDG